MRQITSQEVPLIRQLALKIWPHTFKDILSLDQVNYMLDLMYKEKTLFQQIEKGHQFFVLEENNEAIGFVGIELNYPEENKLRIHKIYLLPEKQGLGLGKVMINFLIQKGKELNCVSLHLNVNRFNNAVEFYKRIGFEIIAEEDIDIGNGYLMEDFVMEYKLLRT